MMMKYSEEFKAFWERVVFRNIAGKLWLIDPELSYYDDNAITLDGSISNSQDYKKAIPNNVVHLIYKEFSKIRTRSGTAPVSNAHSCDVYPWKVGIELTGQCNFNCIHCYAKPLKTEKQPSYNSLLNLIDNLYDSGVLFIWFTGGECTLREDFADIYTYAKKRGFVVSIVTNGSLIPNLIKVFNKYPPKMIKVSQYGSSPKEYLDVTGSATNYDKFVKGIEALSQSPLNFTVQTVLLRENYSSIDDMEYFCDNLNGHHNINPVMANRLDGDHTPRDHEIDQEYLHKYLFSERKISKLKKAFASEKKLREELTVRGEHFCNVGISECFISVDLNLHLCVMLRQHCLSYQPDIPFKKQFQDLNKYRKEILAIDVECSHCKYLLLCHTCPPYKNIYRKDGTLPLKCLESKKRYELVVSN